jgi:hypothetical protein
MIAPRRAHEQRLGRRIPAPGCAADEELAQLFRSRRTTGLPRRDRLDALAAEGFYEEPDLGRLAGSLPAFEGDEAPPQFFAPNMR